MDCSVLEAWIPWFLINISFIMHKIMLFVAAQEQQIPYIEKHAISKTHKMVNWTRL